MARSASVRATLETASFAASIDDALADGRITDEEAEGLQMRANQAVAQLNQALRAVARRKSA
jgi:hypothetical protein